MADNCDHIQCWSLEECRGLTPEEIAFGDKVRSVGIHYTYGRETFHGPTIGESNEKLFAEAKAAGNEPPEFVGSDKHRWNY